MSLRSLLLLSRYFSTNKEKRERERRRENENVFKIVNEFLEDKLTLAVTKM